MSKLTNPDTEPSVSCGFYNAIDFDRKYNANDMSRIFDGIIKDGVFMSIGTAFVATINDDNPNTINIGVGKAWFDHTYTENTAILPVDCGLPDILLDRIDTVVLEINSELSVRDNFIKYIAGIPSSTPKKPEMIKNENVHQYPICYIYRKANSPSINEADITNMIGSKETPFVTGILETISLDELVNQWQAILDNFIATNTADFLNWYNDQKENMSNMNEEFLAWERQQKDAFDAWNKDVQKMANDILTELTEFKNTTTEDVLSWLSTNEANWESEFLTWFQNLKTQMTDNPAVNLQKQIGTLPNLMTEEKDNLVEAINWLMSVIMTPASWKKRWYQVTFEVGDAQSGFFQPVDPSTGLVVNENLWETGSGLTAHSIFDIVIPDNSSADVTIKSVGGGNCTIVFKDQNGSVINTLTTGNTTSSTEKSITLSLNSGKTIADATFDQNGGINNKGQILFNPVSKTNSDIVYNFANKDIYGDNRIKLGTPENIVVGDGSISYGENNKAIGDRSVAIGSNNTVNGIEGVAFGHSNILGNDLGLNVVFGESNVHASEGSDGGCIIVGKNNYANNAYNSTFGLNNYNIGKGSHVEGINNKGRSVSADSRLFPQHVQGSYNVERKTDYVDIIGGGYGEADRRNLYEMDYLGRGFYRGDVVCPDNSDDLFDDSSYKHYLSKTMSCFMSGEIIGTAYANIPLKKPHSYLLFIKTLNISSGSVYGHGVYILNGRKTTASSTNFEISRGTLYQSSNAPVTWASANASPTGITYRFTAGNAGRKVVYAIYHITDSSNYLSKIQLPTPVTKEYNKVYKTFNPTIEDQIVSDHSALVTYKCTQLEQQESYILRIKFLKSPDNVKYLSNSVNIKLYFGDSLDEQAINDTRAMLPTFSFGSTGNIASDFVDLNVECKMNKEFNDDGYTLSSVTMLTNSSERIVANAFIGLPGNTNPNPNVYIFDYLDEIIVNVKIKQTYSNGTDGNKHLLYIANEILQPSIK